MPSALREALSETSNKYHAAPSENGNRMRIRSHKAKTPKYGEYEGVVVCCKSLTMTYFHTGIRTIIGAKSFHCPVRDGKEWDQLAMVVRHKGLF